MHWSRPKWSSLNEFGQQHAINLVTSFWDEPGLPHNQRIEALSNVLLSAQQSLGKRVRTNPDHCKRWWCSAMLDPVIKTQNRACRWFILAKTKEAKECYQERNEYFLRLISALKQKEWLTFLESISRVDAHCNGTSQTRGLQTPSCPSNNLMGRSPTSNTSRLNSSSRALPPS